MNKVTGKAYPASKKGLEDLLEDANGLADKYRLVTVVRLDNAMAAIYEARPPKEGDSFFD